MRIQLRHAVGCFIAAMLVLLPASHIRAQNTEYTIKVMPPGGPPPRLADGHPDLSGHWFPNGAGQAA